MLYVDLRTQPLPDLASRQPALVRAARNPRELLTGYEVYPLVDGPSAWILGIHRPGWEAPPSLQDWRDEHAQVDPLYRGAIKAALEGRADSARQQATDLLQLLNRHLEREETELYPAARAALDPDGRVLRELGYEHQGIRAGMARLLPTVEGILAGTVATKQVEKLELDLLHMFEHHQEREEEALFPWLERVLTASPIT